MSSARELQAILAALGAEPAALATLIAVSGSSYRRPGARLLLLPDGTSIGSISGGCLEEDVRLRARRVLETGEPEVAVYDTLSENDLVWGTGLGCQGTVHVFFERLPQPLPAWVSRLRENVRLRRDTELRVVHAHGNRDALGTHLRSQAPLASADEAFDEQVPAPPSLIVFGAGDDVIPLCELVSHLGWHLAIFDSRSAYATAQRFPQAANVIAASPDSAVRHELIDERSHVIVMTHRYREDVALLRALLPRQLAYLGVLGPRHRTQRILDELAAEGVSPSDEVRARMYAPVGLNLGGTAPETIALSIIAEIQALRSARPAAHLRDSTRPIHG